MKVFVSGLPKSGKTTLVKRFVELSKEKIKLSGFYTEEKTENQKRIGFEIFSIDLNRRFLFASKFAKTPYYYAGYYLFLENLDEVIRSIDLKSQLVVIDEIGKMEMKSKTFENFINRILREENVNLLATLHRDFLNNFSAYGKIFWLKRENWNEVFGNILKIFNF